MIPDLPTLQIIEVASVLKQYGAVASDNDFALSIGYLNQSFNQAKSGKRNLPDKIVKAAIEKYELNPVFIYHGKHPMFTQNGKYNHLNISSDAIIETLAKRIKAIEKNQKIILNALKKHNLI